jgi:hypothetical protein
MQSKNVCDIEGEACQAPEFSILPQNWASEDLFVLQSIGNLFHVVWGQKLDQNIFEYIHILFTLRDINMICYRQR